MKKLLIAIAAVLMSVGVQAQDLFNHLGVGLGVGTTGISVDVAVPVTKFLTVRPGFNYFPNFSYSTDIDIHVPSVASQLAGDIPSSIDIEGKTGLTTGKLLLDFYPSPMHGFHLTVGAYFGKSDVIKAYNKEDGVLSKVVDWNSQNPSNQIGATLGDYLLTPDAHGNVNACIKTKSFRPYVGIGFGRAIPKHFMNFAMELGCQFWGSPKVYCNDVELQEDKVGDGDEGGVIKTISKISVFPVLNFRFGFRVF